MLVAFRKIGQYLLYPENEDSEKYINNLKMQDVITADFKKPRNYQFHKKWFALVKYAYEHWQPSEFEESKWKGVVPQKSFDRFRKDIIIMSGHYNAVYRLDGTIRIEAKSMAFGSMNEEQFNELYNATFDLILDKVLTTYTNKDLQKVIKEIEDFY